MMYFFVNEVSLFKIESEKIFAMDENHNHI